MDLFFCLPYFIQDDPEQYSKSAPKSRLSAKRDREEPRNLSDPSKEWEQAVALGGSVLEEIQ